MGTMVDNTQGTDTPPHGYKYMPCRYCEEPMLVAERRKKLPKHTECGIRIMMDNADQIANKSGPAYDRWRAGMANWIDRSTPGGTPPTASR